MQGDGDDAMAGPPCVGVDAAYGATTSADDAYT